MRILALLLLLIALSLTPVNAEPTPVTVGFEPSYSASGGLITYAAIKGGVRDIYTVDEAGGIRQLTSDIYWDGQPVFTPRSEKIIFISDRSGSRELWQIRLDTLKTSQLTSSGTWKTDPAVGAGGEVAFVSGRHPTLDIYLLQGGVERRLTYLEDELYSPTWSPDAERLAFVRGDELMTINRDGTGLEKIASGVYHRGISWAVDGRILYLTRNVGYDLWSITVEGGEKELIYAGVTDSWEVNPAISGQGEIAFSTDKDGFYTIYEMAINIPPVLVDPAVSEPAPATIPELLPAPLVEVAPAPLPVVETAANTIPENNKDELKNAREDKLRSPDLLTSKDEITLPDPQVNVEPVEPVARAQDEIKIPDHPPQPEGEIPINEGQIGFWLIAASALFVILIERLKYRSMKHALQ
ncbi:translocation protein TolB [archaeon BMS3Abin16]|nr:translocation protein TolB [archaeon BMS3Abin16]